MNSHSMWALPKRVGVIWDVSPVPLGSKESHDPPTVKLGRWLRAKSLHSIIIEHKMSEIKV